MWAHVFVQVCIGMCAHAWQGQKIVFGTFPTVLFIKSLIALDLFKETLQVDQKAPG